MRNMKAKDSKESLESILLRNPKGRIEVLQAHLSKGTQLEAKLKPAAIKLLCDVVRSEIQKGNLSNVNVLLRAMNQWVVDYRDNPIQLLQNGLCSALTQAIEKFQGEAYARKDKQMLFSEVGGLAEVDCICKELGRSSVLSVLTILANPSAEEDDVAKEAAGAALCILQGGGRDLLRKLCEGQELQMVTKVCTEIMLQILGKAPKDLKFLLFEIYYRFYRHLTKQNNIPASTLLARVKDPAVVSVIQNLDPKVPSKAYPTTKLSSIKMNLHLCQILYTLQRFKEETEKLLVTVSRSQSPGETTSADAHGMTGTGGRAPSYRAFMATTKSIPPTTKSHENGQTSSLLSSSLLQGDKQGAYFTSKPSKSIYIKTEFEDGKKVNQAMLHSLLSDGFTENMPASRSWMPSASAKRVFPPKVPEILDSGNDSDASDDNDDEFVPTFGRQRSGRTIKKQNKIGRNTYLPARQPSIIHTMSSNPAWSGSGLQSEGQILQNLRLMMHQLLETHSKKRQLKIEEIYDANFDQFAQHLARMKKKCSETIREYYDDYQQKLQPEIEQVFLVLEELEKVNRLHTKAVKSAVAEATEVIERIEGVEETLEGFLAGESIGASQSVVMSMNNVYEKRLTQLKEELKGINDNFKAASLSDLLEEI